MGFVNINGHQVHTSAYSNGTFSTGIIGSNGFSTIKSEYTISSPKTTYNIFGEDVIVDSYRDTMVSIMVAQLNILGKDFYYELKKQDISFPSQIEEFLLKKFEFDETAKQFIKHST